MKHQWLRAGERQDIDNPSVDDFVAEVGKPPECGTGRERGSVLDALLDDSRGSLPDEIPNLLEDAGRQLGARDVVLYLADYQQVLLVPVGHTTNSPARSLTIDSTVAGRAYVRHETLENPEGTAIRVWLPLIDGGDRLGVVGLTLEELDDDRRNQCRQLASCVSRLLKTRGQFTDLYFMCRRGKAMSLPAEMQWALLPPISFCCPEVSLAAMLEPAYDIAGDAFDYSVNGSVAELGVFDAMGHGLSATTMVTLAVGSYRHCRRRNLDLVSIHEAMDEVITSELQGDAFVTAQLGRLQCTTGQLEWLNAGHPPPLLVRGGRVLGELPCDACPPLGLGWGRATLATQSLEPGDRVLFYTDGVVHGVSATGEIFGAERLIDLLDWAVAAGYETAETVRRLSHAVAAHQEGRLRDDATLVILEWPGPVHRRFGAADGD